MARGTVEDQSGDKIIEKVSSLLKLSRARSHCFYSYEYPFLYFCEICSVSWLHLFFFFIENLTVATATLQLGFVHEHTLGLNSWERARALRARTLANFYWLALWANGFFSTWRAYFENCELHNICRAMFNSTFILELLSNSGAGKDNLDDSLEDVTFLKQLWLIDYIYILSYPLQGASNSLQKWLLFAW